MTGKSILPIIRANTIFEGKSTSSRSFSAEWEIRSGNAIITLEKSLYSTGQVRALFAAFSLKWLSIFCARLSEQSLSRGKLWTFLLFAISPSYSWGKHGRTKERQNGKMLPPLFTFFVASRKWGNWKLVLEIKYSVLFLPSRTGNGSKVSYSPSYYAKWSPVFSTPCTFNSGLFLNPFA